MAISNKHLALPLAALLACGTLALPATQTPVAYAADASSSNMYQNSDFVEKEQPELSDETKRLVLAWQKNPTDENYLNLRAQVIVDYNAVLDRKEAKLAELREETAGKPGGEDIVAEMEEIVQEMYVTYWSRINSSMLRFTDSRLLKWKVEDAAAYDYIPVMGAGESIYIGRTPVTNAEYAEFVRATGAAAPADWVGGTYKEGEGDFPVVYVSAADAEAYCNWLSSEDGENVYRLPSESEWELAAGHMPKDADFNCGVADGRVSVDAYEGITRGAHGAIDFWGNVWEWTSTVRSDSDGQTFLGVKGGSWKSARTDCRTEYRKAGRDVSEGYDDVGFRVVQVRGGAEPAQRVELATLEAPEVSAAVSSPETATLSWTAVSGAVEYQVFEYSTETGLLRMLNLTSETTASVAYDAKADGALRYIVQPVSYTEIADNVSPEYAVAVSECPFSDVPESEWFYDAVVWANMFGVTTGTGPATFSPDDFCTRAQMVTFLWRASGSPEPASADAPFADVPEDAYYADAVAWAAEQGVTTGTSALTFSPDEAVNRGQAVTFLWRAAGSPSGAAGVPFGDVSPDEFYAAAVAWAAEQGITTGTSATTFSPDDVCTRAQTVTFLYRFCC